MQESDAWKSRHKTLYEYYVTKVAQKEADEEE